MQNLFVSCIESRIENPTTYYGSFQLGPFANGQGITIANTLRRVILSELPAVAVVSAKLQTVVGSYLSETLATESEFQENTESKNFSDFYSSYAAHEYSFLDGVQESTLDILLNLKKLVVVSDDFFHTTQVAFIQVQGPGIIQASDIQLPKGLQIVNPDQYIATLTTKTIFQAKLFLSFGKKDKAFNAPKVLEPEILSLEPTFFPIKQVNYQIERDPISVDKEIVTFEIWTNGSVQPRTALEQGLVSILQMFNQLYQNFNIFEPFLSTFFSERKDSFLSFNASEPITSFQEDFHSLKKKGLMDDNFLFLPVRKRLEKLDIGNLNLSLPLYTYLKTHGIHCVQDLLLQWESIQENLTPVQPSLVEELEKIGKQFGVNTKLVNSQTDSTWLDSQT
nr:RNA polymerase a-subunit [Pedinophyceae sp. YPF-701]